MKKFGIPFVAAFVLLTLGTASTMASPVGNVMAGRKYMVAARDLTPWSAGLYYRGGTREAEVGNTDESIEFSRISVYAAYDVLSWLSPYVKIGSSTINLDNSTDPQSKPEFGFGARFNILHHDILDPTFFEDSIMVNASIEYSMTEATRDEDTQTFAEVYASATVSLLNEILGDKFYLPNGIALFLGPSYSIIETGSTTTDSDFGFLIGLEIFYSEKVSFYLSSEQMGKDSTSILAGLNICL